VIQPIKGQLGIHKSSKMSSSPSVKLHPDFQLPEVKLDNARKLDLSLWREDDDEDKDSSIDLPTSPPGATNSSNTKTIVHAQPQSSSSLQPPRHFPLPSSASDFTDDEEDDEASDTSEPHLSLSHITIIKPNKSHPIAPSATSARDDHQHDHQDERKNSPPPPDPLGHEGENNNSNNTTKGGVKKVEFTGIQLDQMSWDKKGAGNTSKRSDSLEKAGTLMQSLFVHIIRRSHCFIAFTLGQLAREKAINYFLPVFFP